VGGEEGGGVPPLYSLEEAQAAFGEMGQSVINFGCFRHLVMGVVRVRRQREEQFRRVYDGRKRFGKGLPDLIRERRQRFEHFETMQRKKLGRELEHEVTSRDKLISLRAKQAQAAGKVNDSMEQRKAALTKRLASIEETHREQVELIRTMRERTIKEEEAKAERKRLARKEFTDKLEKEREEAAAEHKAADAVRRELELFRQQRVDRAELHRRQRLLEQVCVCVCVLCVCVLCVCVFCVCVV
jgi:hypothetical protein